MHLAIKCITLTLYKHTILREILVETYWFRGNLSLYKLWLWWNQHPKRGKQSLCLSCYTQLCNLIFFFFLHIPTTPETPNSFPMCIKNGPPPNGHPANLTQLWEALELTWASVMTWPFLGVDCGFPLSHCLLHPGSVISCRKFLAEALFPFHAERERPQSEQWISRGRTPKSPKWENETTCPLVRMWEGSVDTYGTVMLSVFHLVTSRRTGNTQLYLWMCTFLNYGVCI